MSVITDKNKIKEVLEKGVKDVIDKDRLEKKMVEGKELRIKFGVDVARPDIHLGHTIGLRKLREFQDLGHTIIFLIGDATTKIGDPTGKDKTRPLLDEKEIKENTKTFEDQAGKILDIKKTEIRHNSEWFDKMSMFEFVNLLTMVTRSQVLARDAFKKRIKEGREIFVHELIYPIMQGYDSVVLKADLAVHADQLFNEHFGRTYQEKFRQEPQAILTIPMLVGLDGKNKMSKSLDNYIGITEDPDSQYGKIMSIPDKLIEEYVTLLTDLDYKEMKDINPRDAKMRLASEIVKTYHSENDAQKTEANFKSIFQKKGMPTDMPEIKINLPKNLSDILIDEKIISSKSEFRRLVQSGGIEIDEKKIDDSKIVMNKSGIVRIGKLRFIRIL